MGQFSLVELQTFRVCGPLARLSVDYEHTRDLGKLGEDDLVFVFNTSHYTVREQISVSFVVLALVQPYTVQCSIKIYSSLALSAGGAVIKPHLLSRFAGRTFPITLIWLLPCKLVLLPCTPPSITALLPTTPERFTILAYALPKESMTSEQLRVGGCDLPALTLRPKLLARALSFWI